MQHTARCENKPTRGLHARRDSLWKGADGVSGLAFCGCYKLPQTGGFRGGGWGELDTAETDGLWFWRPGVWDQGAGRASLLLKLPGRVPRRLQSLGALGVPCLQSASPSSRPLSSVSSVHLLKGCWSLAPEPTLNPGQSSHLEIFNQTCKDSLQIVT